VSPWFVPSRPKPPVLKLEIAEDQQQPWRAPTRRLLSGPAPLAYEFRGRPSRLNSEEADNALHDSQEENFVEAPLEGSVTADADGPVELRPRPLPAPIGPPRGRIPYLGMLLERWEGTAKHVKIGMAVVPFLIWLAVHPSARPASGSPGMEERPAVPIVSAHSDSAGRGVDTVVPTSMSKEFEAKVEKETTRQFDGFRKMVASRAAVEVADDFHSGLDNWQGRNGVGPGWSYDRTGFIRPRALAIFRPSMDMADYAFEFLGKVDQHAIGWVFRAIDANNYYAMKLVDKTGGVIPQMALVHYAVIDGREGPKKEVPLPLTVYKDTLFRIRMDIQGPHFSVQVQGQVVDYWNDGRLKTGGVGFFSGRGDESRVRWIQITHQDDLLGKVCAFLSPSRAE
jgi:hypothetical protein